MRSLVAFFSEARGNVYVISIKARREKYVQLARRHSREGRLERVAGKFDSATVSTTCAVGLVFLEQ